MDANLLKPASTEIETVFTSLLGRELDHTERHRSFSRDREQYLTSVRGMAESGLLDTPDYMHYAALGFIGIISFPNPTPAALKGALAAKVLTTEGFEAIRSMHMIQIQTEGKGVHAKGVRENWKFLSSEKPVAAFAVLVLCFKAMQNPEIKAFLSGKITEDLSPTEGAESDEEIDTEVSDSLAMMGHETETDPLDSDEEE